MVSVEEAGVALDGSAAIEGDKGLLAEAIREGMPRADMVAETKSDKSLQSILKLAELDREGYHLVQGLIFRTRLDTFGSPQEQLCIALSFRERCLTAAHTSFGHQGRNRMISLLRPHFYWPCMARDCVTFVRQCTKCQEMDRTVPKPPKMTERQAL